MRKIAIIASQLVGKVSIDGLSQAQADMKSMGTSTQQAQDQIDQLQNTAKDAGSILASRFSTELKNAQSGLQELGSQASNAGIDVSKFTELQQKASDAVAKLGLAQAQAAAAQEKANATTNDASASAEKVALAQARAATAAENVGKAELAAGDAMTMVQGEATRLADALEMTQAKGNIFSGVLGGLKEGASGFFGAISEAPGKLMQVTQEFGMLIFGVQQVVQFGQQLAGTFISLGKQAGDFQQGITQLSTGAGELTSNLGMVSQGILKLAPEVGTTTADLTAGMYQIESAGQHGAQALTTLQDAAEGAKTSNASLADVTNGVTTIMTDYIRQNVSAAQATNTLVESVKFGKSNIGDMSKAMATILPTSAAMGVSLTDVSAAMSTMTHEGTPASEAATYLRQTLASLEAPGTAAQKALASIGLTSTQISDAMKVSLPGALQLIEDHLKAKFPEGSAAYVDAMKNIVGGTRSMQGILELTGANLQTFKDDVSSISGVVQKSGDSIDGWTQIQQDFNFQMQRAQEGVETFKITLGQKLFPVFTQVFGWVASTALPALNSFSNWFFDDGVPAIQKFFSPLQTLGDAFQNFVGHGQAAIPILAGIGAVISALLVPAVWKLAAGVITATWPFLVLAGAVGGLTAVFLHFYNSNAGFHDFINGIGESFVNLWNILTSNISPILHQIGDFVSTTFAPVWIQLQDVWKSQLKPAIDELVASFKQLQPELSIVGEFIGGVLLGALGLLIGSLGGIIGSLAGMAHGIAEIFGGIVQMVSGYVQIFEGFVSFIVDLFTGHFNKLGDDLKVILGGIGTIFSGFGNTLKGIVDTAVGGVIGGFKGMATSVIGYLNDLVHGTDDQTKKASIAAQLNTAQMKDKSIENAQKMQEETQKNLFDMRKGIEDQLKQTTDATDRNTLEMKLKAVNNSLEMAQASSKNFVEMRYKSQEQIDLLKQGIDTSLMTASDKAKYHSLNMKDMYLQGVIQMDNDSIKKIDEMRQGILDELSRTTDGAKKQALEIKLTEVTNAEDSAKKVKDAHVKMRTDTESEMDKLKSSIAAKSGGIVNDLKGFFGNIGNWFHDRWVDVQNAFVNTGQWFHDRWQDAWNATTSFFGNIGNWFHNRWVDVQNVFGSIGAWFHDRWQEAWAGVTGFFGAIGKWFSDRWNEVMSSTAPFRTYMGDVFQTIWNILVAVWGKVSTWFHDRFTEAYNKVVEVFGPIGKWFQDRWHDIQNIFGAIGAWFHDRWVEVWNATTSTLGTIGNWFHDRWVDIQNIFGGIGAWFHDRWQEAWSATTAVFSGVGKWFGDRWHDVQNIFAGVGNWFHDRWTEAWTKMTQIFSPIGQWFSDRWDEIKTKVNEKWNEIKTDASNIFKGIINAIVDQLNNGIGAIESFINFFGQGLDDIAKDLGTKGTIPVAHLARIPHYAEGGEHPGGPAIVGEKGREMVFLPAGATVVPNNITETLLSLFSGGKIPGYAGGIGDIASSIASWISGGAKSLLDNVISALHIQAPDLGPMSDIASGIFNEVKGWALSWVSGILPKFSSLGTPTNMPGNLASWIMSAIALTSTPGSWLADLETIAMHESGGNPNAINNWDINAQQGHPSQGLFQTIPSTFSAYALPGHGNILNPIDNAAAAIGYIKSRYGDVFHVPGIVALSQGGSYVGYANGGVINEPIAGVGLNTGTRYAFGENGKELVTPYASLASQSSPTINVVINVQPNDFNIDGRKLARALMPHHVELVRQHSGVKI